MIKPQEALDRLLEGNKRFVANQSLHPNRCQETKDSLLHEQRPFAVILSCSDSRVPIEIIFDAGFGDIFVVRTAGHVLSQEVMGSIEYAVRSLGVKLVMILGHDNCGAVQSAIKSYKNKTLHKLSSGMQSIMTHIYPAIEGIVCETCNHEFLDAAIESNVIYQVNDLIKNDEYIAQKVKNKDIMVIGANYNLKTSKVDIITAKN
ncbi:MAG: carbonic anhydrase [Candidatus Gastranaerophilales bacterium]|nr:carbonic anhydrase [Candidatus Gastranaerophilales bacterium]